MLLLTGMLFIMSCTKNNTTPFVCGDTIKDIDGNTYHTISFGSQCWTVENLKTSKCNDGTAIPTGLDNAAWAADSIGAFAVTDNADSNNTRYGKLYNWYAVHTGKLAPSGWHVPADSEWTTLVAFLGGESDAPNKMKSTNFWVPVSGITNTNSSGFTGLPAGYRYFDGTFLSPGYRGCFWSSTDYLSTAAYARILYYNNEEDIFSGNGAFKKNGFSVRCVRD